MACGRVWCGSWLKAQGWPRGSSWWHADRDKHGVQLLFDSGSSSPGGICFLVDLGPGTAVSGMRIEINTGHSRTVFNTVEVVYMALRVNGVLGPVFHQGRGVPMALSILGPQSHLLGSPGQLISTANLRK